jgi:hypothetical protein
VERAVLDAERVFVVRVGQLDIEVDRLARGALAVQRTPR